MIPRAGSEPERPGDHECVSRAHSRLLLGNQNWIAQAAHPINQRKEVINVDFILTDNHHFEFRRQDATYFEYQPFDQGSGLTGKYFNRPNQTNVLAWTWTITPTLINELRGTVSIDRVYIPVNTALAGFNRETLGNQLSLHHSRRQSCTGQDSNCHRSATSTVWPAVLIPRTPRVPSTRSRIA